MITLKTKMCLSDDKVPEADRENRKSCYSESIWLQWLWFILCGDFNVFKNQREPLGNPITAQVYRFPPVSFLFFWTHESGCCEMPICQKPHAQITSAGNISDATFQIHLPAMQHPCMLVLGSQVSELSVTGSDLTACMQKTRTVVLHESLLSSEVIFIIKCHCEKCEIAKGWAWPRMSEVNGIHSDGLTSQRQKVWRYERGGREAQGASDSFHPCSLADHRYC